MKKRSLQSKLTLNKQTLVKLNAQQTEAVKGGQSLACIQTRFICGETRPVCITQTEFQTCRCV